MTADDPTVPDGTDTDTGEREPADTGGAVETDGESSSGRAGGRFAYSAVMVAIVALGGLAAVVGIAGTIVVLTGGVDGGDEFEVLGEFECDSFDSDPQVVHDADYEIEKRVLSPSEVAAFNGSVDGNRVEITLQTEGPLLAASANEPDGTPFSVRTDDSSVEIERQTTTPFRLWVDTVAADGTVTRMELDVCPPS